jgi:MFS family permease
MKSFDINITFREIKMNRVVRFFILSDYIFWSGWGIVNPVFAVFILQKIGEANVFTIGAAAAVYYLSKALSEVPISVYLDKHNGEKDDFYALVLGLLIGGCVSLTFLAVRNITELLLVMVAQGIAFALYSSSWPTIFSRHLDKDQYAIEWTLDHFGIDVLSAAAAFLGGGIALVFGFNFIFIFAAVFAFIAASVLFFVPDLILPKDTLKQPILKDHIGPIIGR